MGTHTEYTLTRVGYVWQTCFPPTWPHSAQFTAETQRERVAKNHVFIWELEKMRLQADSISSWLTSGCVKNDCLLRGWDSTRVAYKHTMSYYWNQLQRISVAQLTAAGRSWMWFFFPFGWLKSKHSTESWSMKSRMGCFYTSLGGVDLIWNPHDLFNVLSPSSRNFYFFSSGVSLQPIVRSAVEIQTLPSSV